jgi:hypothetical protein
MRRGGLIFRWRGRNAPEWKSIEQRVPITWTARHLVVSALGLSVPSIATAACGQGAAVLYGASELASSVLGA